MAPIIPDPRRIKSFRTEAAFAAWMKANHARETELLLKIHKKSSGLATVTSAQTMTCRVSAGESPGVAPVRSSRVHHHSRFGDSL
jgi:hypothetical protein